MKIAIVFSGLGFGGIERVGSDYVKLLNQLGHVVDVYNLNPGENAMVGEFPKGTVYYKRHFSPKLCPEIYSYGTKKWWWGKIAYPILHLCTTILLGIKRLFRRRRKYDIAIAFTGHFQDLTFVAKNFVRAKKKLCWLHGCLAEYLMIADGYIPLYRKIKNLAVLSDLFDLNVYCANRYLKSLNVKKIYNPSSIKQDKAVDNDIVVRLKEKYGDFILNVARFSAQKDQRTIVDCIANLKEQGAQKEVVFLGEGPTLEDVKKYAEQKNVRNLCHFEGGKLNVQDYYSAATVFLHSSYAEGLPTVLIEAMSFGLPIVATNSLPGVEEILEGGKYGLVSKVGDAAGLAENVRLMYENHELYEKYKQKGIFRMRDFLPETVKDQLKQLLDELI